MFDGSCRVVASLICHIADRYYEDMMKNSHLTLIILFFSDMHIIYSWRTTQTVPTCQSRPITISAISHLPSQISRNWHCQCPTRLLPTLPQIWESLFMILKPNCTRYVPQKCWRPLRQLTSFAAKMCRTLPLPWKAWCKQAAPETVLKPNARCLLVFWASRSRSTTS